MTDGYRDPGSATGDAPRASDAPSPTNNEAALQQIAELTRALHEAEQELSASRARECSLTAELQHRVRNNLAVVRSVFSRTADTHEAIDDVADHFRGRLDALARHQTSFLPTARHGRDLESIVSDELLATVATDDPRLTVRGPAVDLTSKAAESLGLAIHELVTNSIKFGVLSQAGGRGSLVIEWDVSPPYLNFAWHETGVTILASAPLRTGFGHDFIENALPYQLGAETSVSIEPGAIVCRIRLMLETWNATGTISKHER